MTSLPSVSAQHRPRNDCGCSSAANRAEGKDGSDAPPVMSLLMGGKARTWTSHSWRRRMRRSCRLDLRQTPPRRSGAHDHKPRWQHTPLLSYLITKNAIEAAAAVRNRNRAPTAPDARPQHNGPRTADTPLSFWCTPRCSMHGARAGERPGQAARAHQRHTLDNERYILDTVIPAGAQHDDPCGTLERWRMALSSESHCCPT